MFHSVCASHGTTINLRDDKLHDAKVKLLFCFKTRRHRITPKFIQTTLSNFSHAVIKLSEIKIEVLHLSYFILCIKSDISRCDSVLTCNNFLFPFAWDWDGHCRKAIAITSINFTDETSERTSNVTFYTLYLPCISMQTVLQYMILFVLQLKRHTLYVFQKLIIIICGRELTLTKN
jgi:hypothetical protein